MLTNYLLENSHRYLHHKTQFHRHYFPSNNFSNLTPYII
ncbi:hypothetical protein KKH3_02050 [Pectobacterium actinidiae]|nr:hypothetical protein KKH3_02050 [Pectobacterium actinidiae]